MGKMSFPEVKTEFMSEIMCRDCGQSCNEWGELINHREEYHKFYSCKCCLKQEFSLLDFEYHLQSHGGMKLFKCIICSEDFHFLTQLNDHLPSHLPGEKTENLVTESINEATEEEIKGEENNLQYEEEIKEEESDHQYEEDIEEPVNSLPSPKFESIFIKKTRGRPRSEKQKQKYAQMEKRFQCFQCPHSCKTASNLKLHMRTHTGERPYECAICGKSYAVKSSVRTHLVMKHSKSKEKTEFCPYCGKAFYFSSRLKVHVREIHSRKREKHPCFVCGKTYSSKGSVAIHMQVHEKKSGAHKCSQCERTFDTHIGMIQHVRYMHVAEKKYKCNFESCNFRSISKAILLEHQRKHTGEKPFSCNICSTAFSTKAAVGRHVAQRHNPPKIQCEFCDKLFKVTATLRCHMRRVHLERKIVCTICNKKYGSQGDLTRHTRDSHSDKKKFPMVKTSS